jgi:eukaryotic-like serine/threonine-protein kinase
MTAPNGAFVPFMVLEWLEGQTLDALVRSRTAAGKRPLSLGEALDLIEPVARALDRAHHFNGPAGKESVAHCDLKPENVFIAAAGGERLVKILDFGVAKVRSAATREAPAGPGQGALFTPAYGAPEQWNAKTFGETGPWTDVWGLGLTLAETLVGRPVIAGDHVSLMRQALDMQRRPTPGAHGVELGDALEAVLQRALAVDPRERYPDAGAFLRALKAAARGGAQVSSNPPPEIPDLVPLPRKPSRAQRLDLPPDRKPSGAQRLDLPPDRKPSGAQKIELGGGPASGGHKLDLPTIGTIDFDDASEDSSGLSLDLPAGDPMSTRTIPIASPVPAYSAPPPEYPSPAPISGPPSYGNAPTPPPSAPPLPQHAAPAAEARPAPPPPQSASSPVPAPQLDRPLLRRLIPGLAVASSSILLTLLDRVYAAVHGEVFTLGPLRTSWIAAVLLVTGLVLAARQLVPRA